MDRSFADELYSETLRLSNGELGPISSANDEQNGSYDHELDQLSHDDGSLWGSSPEEHDSLSDLDREWKRRHDQFHTVSFQIKAIYLSTSVYISFCFLGQNPLYF
ncbi:hypothetical protein CsSME_00020058 [Camellia sinensis var. sinensis]